MHRAHKSNTIKGNSKFGECVKNPLDSIPRIAFLAPILVRKQDLAGAHDERAKKKNIPDEFTDEPLAILPSRVSTSRQDFFVFKNQ